MGSMFVFNVQDSPYNASGDGTTDDTSAIQSALDAAETAGGGIVYFPVGEYLISDTLKLPNKVYMKGVGGTTFGIYSRSIESGATPSTFLEQMLTIIKLEDNSDVTMIIQKGDNSISNYTNFYQSGIEDIVLFGNKANQSLGHGIYLNDATDPARGHCRFRNILIFDVKQVGFYDGADQHEVFLDEVIVYNCGGDGIVLKGQDIKASRVQSACNGGTGIKISIGGAGRFDDIDCWSNDIGVEIFDTCNLHFFGLKCSTNKKNGISIHEGVSPAPTPNFVPYQIQIIRAIFDLNSTESNGGYSDILVNAPTNTSGPSDISFFECQFRGSSTGNKANYAIMDTSSTYYPARNKVISCYIERNNYSEGKLLNRNDIYLVRDCYDYSLRKNLDEFTIPFVLINNNYTLLTTDSFVTLDTSSVNKQVTLPKLSETQIGKVYFISKTNNSANSITICPNGAEVINGVTSINQQFQTLMVINAGANWYSVQLS